MAYSDTWNPLGARGIAPSGRLTSRGKLLADGVSKGFGRSSTVILRRTPGASVVQSPRASCPVKTAVGRSPSAHAASIAAMSRMQMATRATRKSLGWVRSVMRFFPVDRICRISNSPVPIANGSMMVSGKNSSGERRLGARHRGGVGLSHSLALSRLIRAVLQRHISSQDRVPRDNGLPRRPTVIPPAFPLVSGEIA